MAIELTSAGLVVETMQEIAGEIGARQLATIDPGLSQDEDDPLRQMNVIVAREIQEACEVVQASYSAFDLDNAEGVLLDNIGDFKGRARLQAQNPRAAVTLTLAAGAVVTAGDEIKSNVNNARTWKSIVSFVAGVSGPFEVVFEATDPSFSAVPGELTVIPSIPGWASATNASGSSPLRPREDDETYRLRLRRGNDTSNGAGALAAIVNEVAQLDGIISADGFENTSLYADPISGAPGMSFEIVVDDANGTASTPEIIAQKIFENKPPGGKTAGTISTQIFDTRGRAQIVKWTRVAGLRMYVICTLKVLPGWSAGQIDNIKARLVAFFSRLRTGQDVSSARVKAAILEEPMTEDIGAFYVGPNPMGGPDVSYAVSPREKATFQGSDLTLTIIQLTEDVP